MLKKSSNKILARKKGWNYISFFLIVFSACFSSCKKFVEVPLPDDQLSADFVFSNNDAAVQAITGIYSEMMNNSQQFSDGFTTFFAGLCSDELYYYSSSYRDEFVQNQISPLNHSNIDIFFWSPCYRFIYAANRCIEGANSSRNLSPSVKNLVIGEAKFIRSFCYFYLVNLFGDVPLLLSSKYQENQNIPRAHKADVYTQMISDLKDAQNLLSESYSMADRVRPNKFAAAALLARIHLYNEDWSNAESQANSIINSTQYSIESDPDNVFKIVSNETIWQLRPVNPYYNTWEGSEIIPYSPGSSPTYLLTNDLSVSFELNDKRKISWTQVHSFSGVNLLYPFKYKIKFGSTLTEYYVVLRLAEQYLIRAEARAHLNDLSGANADLNILRSRAGLADIFPTTQQQVLSAVEKERRVELFAEWGHRWLDLIRTKRAATVLSALKPMWQITDTLWPIPQSQINLNLTLTQNQGY